MLLAMLHAPLVSVAGSPLRAMTKHSAAAGSPDSWMILGFAVVVALMLSMTITRKSTPLFVARCVCLGLLSIVGFASGAWPIGVFLIAMVVREAIDLHHNFIIGRSLAGNVERPRRLSYLEQTERMSRLLGMEPNPKSTTPLMKHKTPLQKPHFDDPMN